MNKFTPPHEYTKNRDNAVDLIKFLAVFLIINSHADIMYPKFSILATGGAIGDALFLFVSGYTLFLGKMRQFDNYYKRRISRIFPSVFSALAFVHLVQGNGTFVWDEFGGGEFVVAIMGYYILLYFIRKYAVHQIMMILFLLSFITLVVYVFWFPYKYETGEKGLYGPSTLFRWIPYFGFMLLGAVMGLKRPNFTSKYRCVILKLLSCLTIFYGIQYAAKVYPLVAPMQIITLIPLYGIVLFTYQWCRCCRIMQNFYQSAKGNKIVLLVSGLCLESYLIQNCLFTDKLNQIWPLNILMIIALVLLCSYLVRCVARLFLQTFREEDFQWREIVKI